MFDFSWEGQVAPAKIVNLRATNESMFKLSNKKILEKKILTKFIIFFYYLFLYLEMNWISLYNKKAIKFNY